MRYVYMISLEATLILCSYSLKPLNVVVSDMAKFSKFGSKASAYGSASSTTPPVEDDDEVLSSLWTTRALLLLGLFMFIFMFACRSQGYRRAYPNLCSKY